jgi:hypothetical protein
MALAISSTILNDRLPQALLDRNVSDVVIQEVASGLWTVSTVTQGTTQQDISGFTDAFARTLDIVFVLPLVSGALAFVCACLAKWSRIEPEKNQTEIG